MFAIAPRFYFYFEYATSAPGPVRVLLSK
jgi:hypothetical protein